MLRQVGVEPPNWHDVGGLLKEHHARFEERVALRLSRLAEASEWLRGERELSLYGDIDFIPTEQYLREDGMRAISEAGFALQTARWVIKPRRSKSCK